MKSSLSVPDRLTAFCTHLLASVPVLDHTDWGEVRYLNVRLVSTPTTTRWTTPITLSDRINAAFAEENTDQKTDVLVWLGVFDPDRTIYPPNSITAIRVAVTASPYSVTEVRWGDRVIPVVFPHGLGEFPQASHARDAAKAAATAALLHDWEPDVKKDPYDKGLFQ